MNKTQKEAVNPTKQHSTKCPKLYGKKCSCDGYHTFDELYEHRVALFIALCKTLVNDRHRSKYPVWKSKLHSDGTMFDGWFVMGIDTLAGEQITYHLPIKEWAKTDWLGIEVYEKAPVWDGHTPDDVLERLNNL